MNDIFFQDDSSRNYYAMNFESHPSISSSDTITGIPIVNSEVRGGGTSDLVIEDIEASGLYVGMWISGGTAYKTYKIEVLAEFNGRTGPVEADAFIRIGD